MRHFVKLWLLIFATSLFALPTVYQGDVAEIKLEGFLQKPKLYYKSKEAKVLLKPDGHYYAMIGVSANEKVGKRHIVAVTPTQKSDYYFQVTAKQYPKEHIKLKTNKHVTLSPKNLKRHKSEKAKAKKLTGSFNKNLVADLAFDPPLLGRISSVYGKRRVFNGKPKSPHSGIDIASPRGTPIKATANGHIAIQEEFFFNGNTIYLDHGEGVVSMYCHMSKFAKKKGEYVTKGEVIGYVGTTGRSTGPHLHFSLILNDQTIDPAYFIADYRKD